MFTPTSLLKVGKQNSKAEYRFKYTGTGRIIKYKAGQIKIVKSCSCIGDISFVNNYIIANMTLTPARNQSGKPHRVHRWIKVYFMEGNGATEYKLDIIYDLK